jgi:toxin secretion/phage lysis holin
MNTIWNIAQAVFAIIGGFVGWFIGETSGLIFALIAFSVIDYLTGVMRAIIEKQLSSRIGARGICKKILIFLLVGIAHLADTYLLGDSGALRTAVIFFYLSNEGISLLENATAIGLPIPEKLKDVLAQIHSHKEDMK